MRLVIVVFHLLLTLLPPQETMGEQGENKEQGEQCSPGEENYTDPCVARVATIRVGEI